ncbi:unnamed protein product [Linum tenue]|uniref:Uncharacterized protein n=1 Tax=Linum tenue TaxID=586396 RepID=A0AAV0KJB4_9ROSI|nr:unnamed protein product [Linum tenue]
MPVSDGHGHGHGLFLLLCQLHVCPLHDHFYHHYQNLHLAFYILSAMEGCCRYRS